VTYEEGLATIGNIGVLGGLFGYPVPNEEIVNMVSTLLESEYLAPTAAVRSLRVQLDRANSDIREADRALADHKEAPTAPLRSSAWGKLARTLGRLPVVRNLRESKTLGRVLGSEGRSAAAAEARGRVQKSLEKRLSDARDRAQQLREQLDAQIERAEQDAEQHKLNVDARKADWVAIFTTEHNVWRRRSESLCARNKQGRDYRHV